MKTASVSRRKSCETRDERRAGFCQFIYRMGTARLHAGDAPPPGTGAVRLGSAVKDRIQRGASRRPERGPRAGRARRNRRGVGRAARRRVAGPGDRPPLAGHLAAPDRSRARGAAAAGTGRRDPGRRDGTVAGIPTDRATPAPRGAPGPGPAVRRRRSSGSRETQDANRAPAGTGERHAAAIRRFSASNSATRIRRSRSDS